MATNQAFQRLPQEVLDLIIERGDLKSSDFLALTRTSKTFRYTAMAARPEIGRRALRLRPAYDLNDLLSIERWAQYNQAALVSRRQHPSLRQADYYACSGCERLLPGISFSTSKITGKNGKWGRDRALRECISCCLNAGGYIPGKRFAYGGYEERFSAAVGSEPFGGRGIICHGCHHFAQAKTREQWKDCVCETCDEEDQDDDDQDQIEDDEDEDREEENSDEDEDEE